MNIRVMTAADKAQWWAFRDALHGPRIEGWGFAETERVVYFRKMLG